MRTDAWASDDEGRADGDREVLATLAEKPDFEAIIETVNSLAVALRTQRRLPATLTETQRHDLRTFLDETLADNELEMSSDEVWVALDPDQGRAPRAALPANVVTAVLNKVDESVEALAFLERMRG